MSEVISAEQLHTDTLKFVLKVANLVTVQEYAEELVEEQGLDTHDAIKQAYQRYDGRETVETLIRWARSICEKHDVE
ncbi:hypothetical protein [Pseudorhizobium flavum]|uniref:hypothetical protein n=1 Tax=Pseudorhizobium flavum TaxID=1335061 RepID=UPI00376F4BF5